MHLCSNLFAGVEMLRRVLALIWLLLMVYVLEQEKVFAQDVATGAIRGVLQDATGARIAYADVTITDAATGINRNIRRQTPMKFRCSPKTPCAGMISE
jgi:hypothetical protein